MNLLTKISNLLRGIRKDEKPQQDPWFGSYLDEDGVVADVLRRVTADPIAVKNWLDPWSWRFPPIGNRTVPFAPKIDVPENAGCLLFAPMSIRNYYGMWHANNPHTEAEDCELTDGVITDPRHPDNFSRRVIERVKAALTEQVSRQLCHGKTDGPCKCQERMGNDFYFLPRGSCLFKKDAA